MLASALVWLKQGNSWAPRAFAVTCDAVWTVVETTGAAGGGGARRFRAVDSAPISTLARVVSQPDEPAVILEKSPGTTAIAGVPIWGSPTSEGTKTVELEFGMPGEPLVRAAAGDGEVTGSGGLPTRRWVLRCATGEASKITMLLRSLVTTHRAADAAEEQQQRGR